MVSSTNESSAAWTPGSLLHRGFPGQATPSADKTRSVPDWQPGRPRLPDLVLRSPHGCAGESLNHESDLSPACPGPFGSVPPCDCTRHSPSLFIRALAQRSPFCPFHTQRGSPRGLCTCCSLHLEPLPPKIQVSAQMSPPQRTLALECPSLVTSRPAILPHFSNTASPARDLGVLYPSLPALRPERQSFPCWIHRPLLWLEIHAGL